MKNRRFSRKALCEAGSGDKLCLFWHSYW